MHRESCLTIGTRHHDLQPGLALCFPGSRRIAETGSVLSHLAILAREARVATVVGYAGAMDELRERSVVRVDGESGQSTCRRNLMKPLLRLRLLPCWAGYMIISLNRWEWNRALFSA
jgi:hypothetical protein